MAGSFRRIAVGHALREVHTDGVCAWPGMKPASAMLATASSGQKQSREEILEYLSLLVAILGLMLTIYQIASPSPLTPKQVNQIINEIHTTTVINVTTVVQDP